MDTTATGYRSLAHWIALASQMEAACLDALFLADVHGMYDVYRGSWQPAVQHAVQVPVIDPVLVVAALAGATTNLGYAVTYSTTYHPPFQCARIFSTLDHLTNGRIAWNIVTSYLASAEANGLGEHLAHDERYDRADEYVEVVRALWEQSWEDDTIVRSAAKDMFADPDKVHEIAHAGHWFRVRGPHQCEPSPQRTPVLYQAGASDRGLTFAARHAEVVFLTLPSLKRGAEQVAELRRRAAAHGRDPRAIKALQGMLTIVGRTDDEAKEKADLFRTHISPDGLLTKWCGWMGIDLAAYPDEIKVAEIRSESVRSVLGYLQKLSPTHQWTVGDVREFVVTQQRPTRYGALWGTPEQIADRMEAWLARTDVDGFNLLPFPPASGVADICTLLIPVLQKRGLFRSAYDAAERTLRERYFGAGRSQYGQSA